MTGVRTILHIGADKTGTTAVQRALADRRDDLADRGVWYPDLDGRPDHRSLAVDRPPPSLRVPSAMDTVVLSSEAMWPLPRRRIGEVLDALPGREVVIVAFLRDPGDHAEAAFNQRLRMSRSERELRALLSLPLVPAPINPIVVRSLRRLRQLERWAETVDERAAAGHAVGLVVRPYRPGWADRWDVVADLCRATGLDAALPLVVGRADPRPNPTPDLNALHASVLVRGQAGSAAQARFLDAVATRSGTTAATPLLSPGLRRHLYRRARPILNRLSGAGGEPITVLARATTAEVVTGSVTETSGPSSSQDRSLDGNAARALLAEIWPTFPAGGPEP